MWHVNVNNEPSLSCPYVIVLPKMDVNTKSDQALKCFYYDLDPILLLTAILGCKYQPD